MVLNKKTSIVKLLKGIESGDPESVLIVNEEKYIQHNPQTHEGSEGLADLFKRLSKTSPHVNIVRVFEDGDFVFAHTEYDFTERNIGFEIFRFENGQAVEHWDNIQKRKGPNSSGHSMVDGVTEVKDHLETEKNRMLIQSFVEDVLIKRNAAKLYNYIHREKYIEHNPEFCDGIENIKSENILFISRQYMKCHRLLAEGNFVLSVCEGDNHKNHSSFFDLYRIEDGKIIEHWDTTEEMSPRSQWKNSNGKF